jgi:integrase
MAKRIAFTNPALEKLIEANRGTRLVAYDTRQPGLMAELREGGTLTFYLYRWANGRPHRIRIGAYPDVPVDGARKQAKLLLADLVKGADPNAIKRAKRTEPTLRDLFDHWMEGHAKPHKRTWAEDQRQFDRLLAGWHGRRLSGIKRAEVQALHARIGKQRGPYAANRVLALLRAMFNKAADVGHEGANPTRGIKKFREQSRDRFLQPAELPTFFAAVNAEPNATLRDFFLLCLFTGARRSNVQGMAWADVDLQGAVWRIPTTKSGDPVNVPLPPAAVEILTRRAVEATGPWVFPGGKKNRAGHLNSPKAAWKRLCERGGFTDLRIHDLRRTLGSWQAAAGASLSVIGASLGHKSQQATAIYARLNLDPVRASVDAAVLALVAAGAPKETEADNANA